MALTISIEENFNLLDRNVPDAEDFALAQRFAPRIRFDSKEPFLPSVAGYTVFRQTGPSPSFGRTIEISGNIATAIEYAIWWDWDIQHLYELEHIWVYLDAQENIVAADASWHGGQHPMLDHQQQVPLEDGKVTVFSEPGKHAFAPVAEWLLERKPGTDRACTIRAGSMGVHVTGLYKGIIHDRTPLNNNVTQAYLDRHAFTPSYEFSQRFELADAALVPWEALNTWIPLRVKWWADHLRETTPPSQRRPLRIAHRGASAYAQEGSSASVEKASELGADMVEIDIRVTADNVPVIAHDSNLKRVFGVEGNISELTLEQLHAITPADKQPVLTFDEMLELCRKLGIGLYLDIKETTPQATAHVIASLKKTGMMNYSVFGAFRPDVIAEIKANEPEAITSILFASTHIDPVALAKSTDADYVHPCWERFDSPAQLLAGEWMQQVRDAGLGVVCWHEERPNIIAELKALGVDGICSDQPELLV